MKKKIIISSAIIFTLSLAWCQEVVLPDCRLEVKVVDPEGNPVKEAMVKAGYSIGVEPNPGGGFPRDIGKSKSKASDANGNVILEFKPIGNPDCSLSVVKEKFYKSVYQSVKWEKGTGINSWKATQKVIIKPIKNPIPMAAKKIRGSGTKALEIPNFDEDFEYDLKLCQALPPNGNGKYPDLIVRVSSPEKRGEELIVKTTIRFRNAKDGMIKFINPDRENGSQLISSNEAPESGYSGMDPLEFNLSNKIANYNQEDGSNYYFRTRTELNEKGEIISCNYGKIYGYLKIWVMSPGKGHVASISWDASYFNPTPNDRNVEFDVKRNLLPEGNVEWP